ncbi:MAG TPA: glutathione binding-like protein [Gammaproteobacteria bacterium]|nr:glutathione binding-like protein [Gammaproteobacteria bacterium]
MDLYFAPLACSMATRIVLYELDAKVNFIYVDIHTDPDARLLANGSDYHFINPMGQVPAIRTDAGELITENPVVLQYVADLHPEGGLAPAGGLDRYRLQQWLNFIATELHKGTYIPLLNCNNPEGAKEFARRKLPLRMGHLTRHLEDHEFMLERFSIADCYLFTVLNWSAAAGIDLAQWPVIQGYYGRLRQRPSVARALADETPIYAAEMERKKRA